MAEITAQQELAVPAAAVWDLIQDFGHIERWWPSKGFIKIQRVDLEGDGIGMVRHIYNEGFPVPVSEKLDFLDPANFTWKLSIVGIRPAGLTRYQATGVLDVLDEKRCRIRYRGDFDAEDGREDEARQFLGHAYKLMFDGLEEAAASGA